MKFKDVETPRKFNEPRQTIIDKEYKCPNCGFPFNDYKLINGDLISFKPEKCRICKQIFDWGNLLDGEPT